jgi:hypothetical protein
VSSKFGTGAGAFGLQGLSAAFMSPAALSIVLTTFTEERERNRALGIWGAIGASGAVVGAVLGGIITTYLGWRWNFFINIFIGAAVAGAALRLVPPDPVRAGRKRIDVLGATLVTGAVLLIVTVYDAEPAERRPHDVIAPPGGRAGARGLRPGPKALAKWLAGSVRKDPADMIAAAFDEAEARDPLHLRTWVVLVDGAEHQLSLIRAEAARRGVTIHIVIDIIHVLEYLWGAAWSIHPAGDPAAEDRVAARALTVLAGGSDRAAAEITAGADAAGLDASRRSGADACVRYLGNKREFLRYDQALDAGWPIATGVIEGACRHLIADRLSIGGARWGLDGAEAILTLRAVISNGDFEEYWRFHLACEHQRLYPGINQGQYALGA